MQIMIMLMCWQLHFALATSMVEGQLRLIKISTFVFKAGSKVRMLNAERA